MSKTIFVLSSNCLDIYTSDINLDNLIESVQSLDAYFNLGDKFSSIWMKIYDEHLAKTEIVEIYLDGKAGFSNTRVVAIWCRSWSMFTGGQLIIYKDGVIQDSISYSQEPRIG